MKTSLLFFVILFMGLSSFGQIFMTRSGHISFFSTTSKETVHAVNDQVYAVIDTDKKNLAFALLVKGFQFDKELMQEHFNENYAESDQYPKATFSGSYSGDVNRQTDGVYNVLVKGSLSFHNVTHAIEVAGTIEVKSNAVIGKTQFKIKPEDYNISIPSLVREKIAKEIAVDVLINCLSK